MGRVLYFGNYLQSRQARVVTLASLLCGLLLLSGCGVVKFVPQGQQQAGTSETNQPERQAQGSISPVEASAPVAAKTAEAIPNPYLLSHPSVPGAAQKQHRKAIVAMGKKNWQQAEALLRQLTADYPGLSGPHLNLGLLYRQTDRLDAAEKAMVKAITVNPNNLDAYNQLAILKRERGAFAEAEVLYKKALAVWPQHPESHRNLGILYDLYMGQFDKALVHFENYRALITEPDPQLAGWIADLKRRQGKVARAGQ